ncbi:erythromycin esterase family protein [Pseudonocardia phyllosphaerae]|uniref:erythromycin esterase family protein n=1 Tax=Pseudonocardia phyllosphaerae TaxID=3390502 RepID=UPI00397BDE6C
MTCADLIDELAAGARVLGWSEGLHNRAEFLRARNAVVAHLVRRGTLRVVAAETNFALSRPVDAWLGGAGPDTPPEDVVHGVWSWNRTGLRDNAVLLRWLRRHNAGVPPQRRVRFVGLDAFGATRPAPAALPAEDVALADELRAVAAAHADHRDVDVRDGAQHRALCAVADRFPGERILLFEQVGHLDPGLPGSLGARLREHGPGPFTAVAAVWRDGEPDVSFPLGRYAGLSRRLASSPLRPGPSGTGLLDLRGTGSDFAAALYTPALSNAEEFR